MPLRPSLVRDPASVVPADACSFCMRPADSTVSDHLGELECTKGSLRYHETCAAYSTFIANTHQRCGIPDVKVHIEVKRGSLVLCDVCRRPGATLKCKACTVSFHLPCAREAAMGMKKTLYGGVPVFSSCSLQLACSQHAAVLTHPLEEPAGLWLEKKGGWRRLLEEAATKDSKVDNNSEKNAMNEEGERRVSGGGRNPSHVVATASVRDRTRVMLEEDTDSGRDRTLALLEESTSNDTDAGAQDDHGEGAVDQQPMAEDQQTVLEVMEIEKKESEVDVSETYDIAGHEWELAANVCRLPPLRPGEARMLGVTLSSPVYALAQRVMAAFIVASRKTKGLRPVVVLREVSDEFTEEGLKKIAMMLQNQICTAVGVNKFGIIRDLPELLPTHPSLEAFHIAKDDARRGLANDPDALGVRVRKEAQPVSPYEVMGVYGGIQMFKKEYSSLKNDDKLWERLGLRCKEEFMIKVEAYAADEELVCQVHLTKEHAVGQPSCNVFPEAKITNTLAEKAGRTPSLNWLITTAFLYGNLTCLINDPTIDPLADKEGESLAQPAAVVAPHNCRMVSCLIRGWPFTVLVSVREIQPGQELLYHYTSEASGNGYWEIMKELIEREKDALALQERQDALKAQLEAERQARLAHEAENERLRAKLEALQATSQLESSEAGRTSIQFAVAAALSAADDVKPPPPGGIPADGNDHGSGSRGGDARPSAVKFNTSAAARREPERQWAVGRDAPPRPPSHRNGDRVPHGRQAIPSWRRPSPRKQQPPSYKYHRDLDSHRRNRSRSRERERDRDGSWRSPVRNEGRLCSTPPYRKSRRERSRSTSPSSRHLAPGRRRRVSPDEDHPRGNAKRSHDRAGVRSPPMYGRGHNPPP